MSGSEKDALSSRIRARHGCPADVWLMTARACAQPPPSCVLGRKRGSMFGEGEGEGGMEVHKARSTPGLQVQGAGVGAGVRAGVVLPSPN